MKIMTLIGAAALAASSLVASAPADAQRYGYDRDGGDHWRGGDRRGYRGDYRRGYGEWRGRRDWGRGDWGRGDGWRGHRRGYGRVVCRVNRGYYGPVRRCFRVYR